MEKQILDHQEIEWQFEATDLEPVKRWLEEHPFASGLAVVPGATRELTDTYYDTEDWRVYHARYGLRVRQDGESAEATMKSLAPVEGALRRRREISEPLEGGIESPKGTPGPVGERVRRLAGAGDLCPLFEVRTRRRTFVLRPERNIRWREAERDATVGELTLDESEISGDGETPTRLSRVEVEVDSDAGLHDAVLEFVGGLRDALGLRPTETSKFGEGLAAAGLRPVVAPDLGPTHLDASLSVGEVAFAILRRHFATMLAHEPGVRLGEDLLKLYADALPRRAERFERDLRRVAGALEPLQKIRGEPSEKMVKLLKTLQDDLGDHQDFVVAAGLMQELGAARDLPPQAVFSIGLMAERYIRDAAEMRLGFLGSKPLRALKGGKP